MRFFYIMEKQRKNSIVKIDKKLVKYLCNFSVYNFLGWVYNEFRSSERPTSLYIIYAIKGDCD